MNIVSQAEVLIKELNFPPSRFSFFLEGDRYVGLAYGLMPYTFCCLTFDEFLTIGNDRDFYLYLINEEQREPCSLLELYRGHLINKTPVGKELL